MGTDSIITRIRFLCDQHGWSLYRLAKESGIAYSTISTMLLKTNSPSIPTLQRICDGFGLTLSQFFSLGEPTGLTIEQCCCLSLFDSLDVQDKKLALAYLSGLAKAPCQHSCQSNG